MASPYRNQRSPKHRQKRLAIEALEVRQLLVSDWQNPGQAWDVNQDLGISPIDALLGINRLNSGVSRTFLTRAAGSTEHYFDVSGDGEHSPLDVLLVINVLNRSIPTVSIELQKDTGTGVGATTDRITTDLSIRGNISRARATELWGRVAGEINWHILKTFPSTVTDQSFTILHDELIAALGALPREGLVTLQFQPRYGAENAEVGNEADLPVSFDRTAPQSKFEVEPNFLGAISMPLATTIEVPLNERASSFTLVASKVKLFDATYSVVNTTLQELSLRGISLSSDGRFLLIDPPTNSQSLSYRVTVQEGAFEDLAGNLNIAFDALAIRFSDTSQSPLTFGQKIDFSATQRTVKEYTFDLTSPDLFMLAGLNATNEMQLDLFSPSGQSLRTWITGTDGGSLDLGSGNWAMLTELGKYTLRVAAPVATDVSLKALLSKQLTSVPADLQLKGSFTWYESQAFSLNVTDQDRVYFENNLNPQTPFSVKLLNQYGQEMSRRDFSGGDTVFNVPSAGRYIALIESRVTLRPVAYDYKVHLSQTNELPLTLGQFHQSTLVTPGQQVFYTFAAKAGSTYALEIESEFGDVVISLPGVFEVNQAGAYAVEDSGDGFVLLAFNRSDITSTFSRFRVVESVTTVRPPTTGTIHTEPLQQGITQQTIQLEQESYEYTFTGTTGELFAFRDNDASGKSLFELLSPTGSIVESTEQSDSFRVYRVPYGGQYRLRAFGDVGTELSFQWQQLSSATLLIEDAAVQGNIPLASFEAYRFTANSSRFFVYSTAPADSLAWKLIDDNGKVFEESDFNVDLAADVILGRSYTLIVEKQGVLASGQFDFQRRNTLNRTSLGSVGTELTGNLPARGDRVVVELSLVAGELLDMTSNLDPGLARVRWLDYSINASVGPIEIDPNIPTLVGSTRKYHVEIQNLTDAPVDYLVKFEGVQNPLSPPSTLVGFDEIRSGLVDGVSQSFTFDVSAGTYFMFDWLLKENPNVQIEITDPSGSNVILLATGTDSSLAIVDTDGKMKVRITNIAATEQPFSFRMISPSTAEILLLGATKSASIVPFGTTFFNIALGSTSEVFLQSKEDANNSTSLYRLNSIAPFGLPFEGPLSSGQFLAGDAIVWASNITKDPYVTQFTTFNMAILTPVQLNSPVILDTEPDVNYLIPFKTTDANTIIGAPGFTIVDQGGVSLSPILNGTAYQLTQPGDYRALFRATNTSKTIELHTQVVANATAALASPVSGTIAQLGDVKRYSIALTAGAPILLSVELSEGGFAQWVAPNGEVSSPLFSGSRVMRVYTTGTYQLEIYSGVNAASFRFELNDLSQATAITPGARTGNTGAGLVEVNRFVALPNQLLELQGASEEQIQLTIVDRLGQPLPQVSFAGRLFSQMPDDGIAFILVQSLPGSTAVDFAYVLDLLSTQTQAATIGQPISASLSSRLEGKAYTFKVTQPTWLRVGNKSTEATLLVLKMADGSLRSSPEGFFALLLAGDYEVAIYNDSRSANSFTLTMDLLSQASVVPLNQTTTISKAGRYRVDINTPGRFELQLQNSSSEALATRELTVTDLNGIEVIFDPRGTFDAGSYWVAFNPASTLPAGDYKLNVASITTTASNLAVGTLGEFTLNANGLQEQLVTVQLTPGMRLLIDELELGSGGFVEFRFNRDSIEEWASVDELPAILIGTTGDETLQFRIRGTGLVRLHVVDLSSAAALTLGVSTSVDLGLRRRGQAWLIGGNIGDIVDFINDSSTKRPVQWMVVDEVGRIVAKAVDRPINFSIVNRQRYAVVVVATEPLTTTVSVPFRAVVS